MKQKRIAEPDYKFKLEHMKGYNLAGKVFFGFEVLIIKCTEGEARILINSNEHRFVADTNFLLSDGVMLKFLECSDDFSITILRFSSNFFNEIYPTLDGRVIETMPFSAPDLYVKEGVELLDLIFRQLCCLYERQEYPYKNKILIHLVISYILEIYEQTYRHIENRMSFPLDHKSLLLEKFYCLCCEEHLYHRNIEYYAEKLNITSRYLYKLSQESFHMTPKQCIDYIISGNAKKMLLSTELSTQQIANELNFSDQSAFGQFFKRNVGMSPTDFRNRFK